MTTPDIAGLSVRAYAYKEKGDRAWTVSLRMPEQGSGHWDVEPLVSGPEAADTLERQAAEIKRLRVALEEIKALPDLSKNPADNFDRGARAARLNAADIARAALTGEDTATLGLSGETQTDDRTRGDG
jgi:hypothetical protein